MCGASQASRDVRQPALTSSRGGCVCKGVQRPWPPWPCVRRQSPTAHVLPLTGGRQKVSSLKPSQHQVHQRVLRDSSECKAGNQDGERRGRAQGERHWASA